MSDTAGSIERHVTDRVDQSYEEVEHYLHSVNVTANDLSGQLARRDHDPLETFLVVTTFEDSTRLNVTRRFQAEFDQSGTAETELADLQELFTLFDAARQYIKTVVVESQLVKLSRQLVYTGIIAVAIAVVGIFTYKRVATLSLPGPALLIISSALVAVTLSPLAVPSAYVLRVATVARETAAFGTFLTGTERKPDSQP